MAFDFGRLTRPGAIAAIKDPSALFDALPNKAEGYGYLRAVQKTLLDQWDQRRNEPDLVVKTNTGGGKTIIGLLVLQCCIHERRGPALYLTPDAHLADRVREEARNLGVAVVAEPDDRRFLAGDAICVTTMRTLVNGKSRFGLNVASGHQPIPVKYVVIDDAHAALALTEEGTHLTIPSSHSTYTELLRLFADDLKEQSHNAYMDIQDGDCSAVLRVPFWAWQKQQTSVHGILHPHRKDKVFEWSWPLISDLLPLCQAVVTAGTVEIVPPCPPIEKVSSFAEADRRIYLTATLADDSVLITHFNADPNSVANPLVPDSAADLGDRLVLAPEELNPTLSHEDVRTLARKVAVDHNVVVLVPSHRRAELWGAEANRTVSTTKEISDAVEELKGSHVGLVVIVNRYDGIDLPDDACRVLVVDSLPFAFNGVERREAVALRDSEAMVTRQLQRLEQGMGRGVRGRDDRCVVILMGSRLLQLVAMAEGAGRLSPATRAQLELSRRVAGELEGADVQALLEVVSQVIKGDSGFRRASREALHGVTYGPAVVSPWAAHLRAAYNSAVCRQDEEAVAHASRAVDAALEAGDRRLGGWLGETYASYMQAIDAVAAQEALTKACRNNPAILRPLAGVQYQKIETSSAQAERASEFLCKRYKSPSALLLGFRALLDDLDWNNERTDQAEDALAALALHLGFASQQPERTNGRGSDVLWALGENTYAVIEAKTGATAPLIWKKDINQLAGSVNWFAAQYGTDRTVIPVLVHPSNVVEETGTPPQGAVTITTKKMGALKLAVSRFSKAISYGEKYRNPEDVQRQLEDQKLLHDRLFATYAEETRCQASRGH